MGFTKVSMKQCTLDDGSFNSAIGVYEFSIPWVCFLNGQENEESDHIPENHGIYSHEVTGY